MEQRAADQARARRNSLLELPFQVFFLNSVQGTALVALALWMGAGPITVSVLASFPFFGNLFAVFGPYALERLRTKRRLTIMAYSASLVMYAVLPSMAAAAEADPSLTALLRVLLVIGVGVGEMFRALANVSYVAWFADVFPPDKRARYFSSRFSVMAVANMMSGLAIGQYLNFWGLGRDIDPIAFYTLVPFAMLCMAVALAFIARMPGGVDPDLPTAVRGIRGHLAPLTDPTYRGFLAARAVQAAVFMLVGPFFTVFLIVDLGLSYSTVFILQMVSQAFTVLGYRFWEPTVARVGPRRVFCVAAIAFSIFPMIYVWAGVAGLWLLVPLHVVSGFFEGGFILAVQLLTMNLAPEKRQIAYIGTANAVTGLLWGLASVVGGLLVGPLGGIPIVRNLSPVGSGLPALFLISGVLRLAIIPSLRWIADLPARPVEATDGGANKITESGSDDEGLPPRPVVDAGP